MYKNNILGIVVIPKQLEEIRKNASREGIKKIRVLPSQGYSSIEEELDDLNNRLKGFSTADNFFHLVCLPCFVADKNHPETISLIKKYRRQRLDITRKYSNRCVLEVTLEQLCKNPSH